MNKSSAEHSAHTGFLIVLLALTAFFTGCSSPDPRPYNVDLDANQNLGSSTVRVDLIGISSSDANRLMGYPIDKYWDPSNPLRQSLQKKTFVFGEGQPTTHVLAIDDPIWNEWLSRGADQLLIIADLPGVFKEGSDLRRLVIPLDLYRWPNGWFWRTKTIDLQIQAPLIQLKTAQIPQPTGN
ncbi:MAG: hypothetical protein ACQKBV_09435 [Puniceicoccales bacterium]